MEYELTIRLLLETPVDEDRVTRQVESLFAFGTVLESVTEALKLDAEPHFLSVTVSANSARITTLE
jgi:hypothetical protein